MVDFHTHILPQMDDGSKSISESLNMLSTLKEQGVDTVCLTPHFVADYESIDQFLERRMESFRSLDTEKSQDLPKLVLGAEVQYYRGISRLEGLQSLRLTGTKLLLLEMPFNAWSDDAIEEVVQIARKADYTVVLAHIERYLAYLNNRVYDHLLENGICFQSNAEFFVNSGSSRKAIRMLKNGQIHFLGTDSHNMQSRKPNMAEAQMVINKQLGSDAFHYFESRSSKIIKEWTL